MKISTFTKNFAIFAVGIILPLILLFTTNFGLNTLLTAGTMFCPIPFSYSKTEGAVIGRAIKIDELKIKYENKQISIDTLTFDWQQRLIHAKNIVGIEQYLPFADRMHYQPLYITTLNAWKSATSDEITHTQISGHVKNVKLNGQVDVKFDNNIFSLNRIFIDFANNFAKIEQENNNLKWEVKIEDTNLILKDSHGAISSDGVIQDLYSIPQIKANIICPNLKLNDFTINKLQAKINFVLLQDSPISLQMKAHDIKFKDQGIHAVDMQLSGDIHKHKIIAQAIYKDEPITLNLSAAFTNDIWKSSQVISYRNEKLSGNSTYTPATKKASINMQGKIFKNQTNLTLHLTPKHQELKVNIFSGNDTAIKGKITNNSHALNGKFTAKTNDIAFLMQWMPTVTRLKGEFAATADISGTLQNPQIQTFTKVSNISATIPNLGIKIKPMELELRSDGIDKFILNGNGKMRRGSGEFSIHGYIEPFKKDMPNSFTIEGTNVEFINNKLARLVASHKLNLQISNNLEYLNIVGDINIHSGSITFADKKSTIKSKDVTFINEATPKKFFKINPDINLRINDGVTFKGLNLDAEISGKLNISRKNYAHYAEGRISIKTGKYRIPGKDLFIDHGRLLYPPGTLFVNPILDIKLYGIDQGSLSPETSKPIELFIQGTAQKPVITEHGLTNDRDRALSQAIISSSNVISKNILHEKLKISEIGLSSRSEANVTFFDDPSIEKNSLRNKDFVIGRPLGKRFYLQYLHGLGDTNKRVRLKYSLNDIWFLGIESGTEGSGIDLGFAIERD